MKVTVNVNTQMEQYLNQLIGSGLYGSTQSAVLERLCCEGIIQLLKDDMVTLEKPKGSGFAPKAEVAKP